KCQVQADGLNVLGIRVFDAKGRWLKSLPAGSTEVSLPRSGVFLLEIHTDKGKLTKRVIAQ
ncbi:MAG: T9SS type A sorting domain-containing protein, partial [Saprospiraceae bacterium]|nr:T9SS type A sorting domain-containing protein [Saprospiraceae bacterium]